MVQNELNQSKPFDINRFKMALKIKWLDSLKIKWLDTNL